MTFTPCKNGHQRYTNLTSWRLEDRIDPSHGVSRKRTAMRARLTAVVHPLKNLLLSPARADDIVRLNDNINRRTQLKLTPMLYYIPSPKLQGDVFVFDPRCPCSPQKTQKQYNDLHLLIMVKACIMQDKFPGTGEQCRNDGLPPLRRFGEGSLWNAGAARRAFVC